tara:strand:+ start:951 stop:1211 length:261 start_codon:yes stop_codon:yes gene_type:complete
MSIEGLYNKENLFAEWKLQKTKAKKVQFLKDMIHLKQTQPAMFRGLQITLQQFKNTLAEWEKKVPFKEMKDALKRKQEQERLEKDD